jgi:WD40 repeat protein
MDAYISNPLSSHHHPKISSVQVGGKPQGGIMCLPGDSKGNLLAGYGDNGIYLWDLKQQQPIKSFIGHTGWPTCLKILPDNRLLSVGLDKTMKFWSEEACERSIALSHAGHSIGVVDDQLIIADRKAATLFSLSELIGDTQNILAKEK